MHISTKATQSCVCVIILTGRDDGVEIHSHITNCLLVMTEHQYKIQNTLLDLYSFSPNHDCAMVVLML